METNRLLADRLNELCKEKGVSAQELSDIIGVPVSRVRQICYGRISDPGVFTMIGICDGLGITLDEFFGTEKFLEYRDFD